jgi:outer membrane protein OmpA-like peptidoglycan-associated protein
MAFNLNKNDGSDKDSSNKTTASSKFDLSKGEAAVTTTTQNPSKWKTWIIGLAGLLIIGSGIWYYSADIKTTSTVNSALTEVSPSDSSAAAVPKNQINVQSDVVVTDTTMAQDRSSVPVASGDENTADVNLNNKVPVTFGQGSSSFINVDQLLIKRIVSYLTENPVASINVNGYASSDGSSEINQTISQARADAFKRYLVSKNVAESRIIAVGKGIQNPIASNNSNAGRKRNRRVEITLP